MTKFEIKYELKPSVLIHMFKTVDNYKSDQKITQLHIEHLQSLGKDVSFFEKELKTITESKDLLNKKGNAVELKLWSKNQMNAGDIISGKILKRSLIIDEVIEQRDHKGNFENKNNAKNTFYVLHATPII